ncbi:hypothetical protein BDY19DRAFT_571798 [Irpex rosettiformis]|uniref:Uncharacterized protein n=1 Tax=Irpex rosettiformis TaxID=378272 RepID=A0ACB8UCI1_9APHY|nr:hypothetical protein BDY19DRAFT_571798 [Irpex rosettiformis]
MYKFPAYYCKAKFVKRNALSELGFGLLSSYFKQSEIYGKRYCHIRLFLTIVHEPCTVHLQQQRFVTSEHLDSQVQGPLAQTVRLPMEQWISAHRGDVANRFFRMYSICVQCVLCHEPAVQYHSWPLAISRQSRSNNLCRKTWPSRTCRGT